MTCDEDQWGAGQMAAELSAAGCDSCAICGSKNIALIEWEGPRGVADGGQEYRLQAGIKCRDCGEIEAL